MLVFGRYLIFLSVDEFRIRYHVAQHLLSARRWRMLQTGAAPGEFAAPVGTGEVVPRLWSGGGTSCW
jgi:hypothetical protein